MSSAAPINAAPVQVDVGPVAVDHDVDHPTHPVRIVFVPGSAVWATPDEALDLAVRLMQVANDARDADPSSRTPREPCDRIAPHMGHSWRNDKAAATWHPFGSPIGTAGPFADWQETAVESLPPLRTGDWTPAQVEAASRAAAVEAHPENVQAWELLPDLRAGWERIIRAALTAAAQVQPTVEAQRMSDYLAGRWCGECRYGVVEEPPCCTQPVEEADGITVEAPRDESR